MAGNRFPFHRRTANGLNLYRVASEGAFEEIQLVGSRRVHHRIAVRTYPDRVFLQELEQCAGGRYEEVDATIWEKELAHCTR
jgi:hypothetical protein